MLSPDDDALHLLLADAHTGRPTLARGLSARDLAYADPRARPVDDGAPMGLAEAPPGDLARQGWTVLVEAGPAGRHVLAALEPLIAMCSRQQGAPVAPIVFPGVEHARDVGLWVRGVLDRPMQTPLDPPVYVLIAGDPDALPFELERWIALYGRPGRIAFDTCDDYVLYAEKVLAWAAHRDDPTPGVVTCLAVDDGTHPLALARTTVMDPLFGPAPPPLGPIEPRRVPQSDDPVGALVAAAQSPRQMLVTLAHGAGPPLSGWSSAEEQRAVQGAVVLDAGRRLDAEFVAAQPFVPGGLWVALGCFSAATRRTSPYRRWLEALHALGRFEGSLAALHLQRPLHDGPPFVTRAAQAALANPDGPLAVLGHASLAWQYAWRDADHLRRNVAHRLHEVWRRAAAGEPVGFAAKHLWDDARVAHERLATLDAHDETPCAISRRGVLWLTWHDLMGYMVLGDPAVRLAPEPPDDVGVELAAVARVLAGHASLEDEARRLGRTPRAFVGDVWRAAEAARAALGQSPDDAQSSGATRGGLIAGRAACRQR